MVQFKTSQCILDSQERSGADEYWRLERPSHSTKAEILKGQLREKAYYFKPSATKDRLRNVVVRCELGFLSYDKYPAKELKELCKQRRLELGAVTTKDNLVQILELADDNATFDRFLDLPPELRNRIYTFHFDAFASAEFPTTPPIARVSRQLRQETLVLFYQAFKIRISTCTYATKRLFVSMPIHCLENLRRFEVHGAIVSETALSLVLRKWDVNLGTAGNDAHVSVDLLEWHVNYTVDGIAVKERVEARLKKEFEAIAAREGQKKLRRSDVDMFRRVFEPEDEE